MSITLKETHEKEALGRLLEQFKGLARVQALIESYVSEIQNIEGVYWDLHEDRWVDSAQGAQLENLGEVVGQEREGRTDSEYRTWIKARIVINRSSGKASEMLRVGELVIGSLDDVDLVEEPPASVAFRVTALAEEAGALAEVLAAVTPAGVRFTLEWTDLEDAETFAFSEDLTLTDDERGFSKADHSSWATEDATPIADMAGDADNDIQGIATNGPQVLVGNDQGRTAFSPDGGMTWQVGPASLPGFSSRSWRRAMVAFKDRFIQGSYTSNLYTVSEDGSSVFSDSLPVSGANQSIRGAAYSPTLDRIVFVGADDNNDGDFIMYSTDGGVSFRQAATPFASGTFNDVVWTGTRFVAALFGSGIAYSDDGVHWLAAASPPPNTSLLAAAPGKVYSVYSTGITRSVYESTDGGETWSAVAALDDAQDWISVAYLPSAGLILGDDRGRLYDVTGAQVANFGSFAFNYSIAEAAGARLFVGDQLGQLWYTDTEGGQFVGAIAP